MQSASKTAYPATSPSTTTTMQSVGSGTRAQKPSGTRRRRSCRRQRLPHASPARPLRVSIQLVLPTHVVSVMNMIDLRLYWQPAQKGMWWGSPCAPVRSTPASATLPPLLLHCAGLAFDLLPMPSLVSSSSLSSEFYIPTHRASDSDLEVAPSQSSSSSIKQGEGDSGPACKHSSAVPSFLHVQQECS
jgi:hypothetical protein